MRFADGQGVDVERAEKRIRDLLRPGKPLPADEAAAAAAAKRFTEIGAIPAAVASDRLRSLPADAPADVVLSLLRIVLRLDRTNADAAARVRASSCPSRTTCRASSRRARRATGTARSRPGAAPT